MACGQAVWPSSCNQGVHAFASDHLGDFQALKSQQPQILSLLREGLHLLIHKGDGSFKVNLLLDLRLYVCARTSCSLGALGQSPDH